MADFGVSSVIEKLNKSYNGYEETLVGREWGLGFPPDHLRRRFLSLKMLKLIKIFI